MVFGGGINIQNKAILYEAVENRLISNDISSRDSDKDGLSDRDEIIFATDPFNADTDGDGFKDGEETANRRDPLDPDDNINTAPDNARLSFVSPTANLTDRLFNLAFASLINDSGNLDPAEMTTQKYAAIVADLQQQTAILLTVVPPDEKEIKIITDNSNEAIKKYIATVSPILEEGLFSSAAAFSGGINSSLTFDPDYYENKYNSLKVVGVPSSWKEIHLEALWHFSQLATSFRALGDEVIEDDPLKASYALSQVQNVFLQINDLLNRAAALARSQNVPYQNSIIGIIQGLNNISPVPGN